MVLNKVYEIIKSKKKSINYIFIYLIPKRPILQNLIKFLSKRQEINIEEVRINHGWRQIEEFSSIVSLTNSDIKIFVAEGCNPDKLANIIGDNIPIIKVSK